MIELVELSTTVESAEQAEAISQQIVTERLAACVQITGPIQSVYRWKGEVCNSSEYRCTMKTTQQMVDALMDRLKAIHPYDVPELLVVQVLRCSPEYEKWLCEQLGP